MRLTGASVSPRGSAAAANGPPEVGGLLAGETPNAERRNTCSRTATRPTELISTAVLSLMGWKTSYTTSDSCHGYRDPFTLPESGSSLDTIL